MLVSGINVAKGDFYVLIARVHIYAFGKSRACRRDAPEVFIRP